VRTAFIEELIAVAEQDERVWLVCGDLGYSVLEAFSDRFPERYLNAGVAEQNMTGIAAGLALSGKVVFTYSIANFPIMRCLEQIRNDVCYHKLDVKVVAVGGGLAYGSHGYTHHGVEDLAIMSAMPNMTVVAPGDPVEARAATAALATTPGPAYLRLGKAGEATLHKRAIDFRLGRAIQIQDGHSLTILSTGGVLGIAVEAAERLHHAGCSTRVLSMPSLVPLDVEAIAKAARETAAIITIEEHGIGGLGTMTAEVLTSLRTAIPFYPLRLGRDPIRLSGSQEHLRSAQGVSVEGILTVANGMLNSEPPAYSAQRNVLRGNDITAEEFLP
jgi:transketolase